MKLEKFFYVIISTVLITAFILISYVSMPHSDRSSPANVKEIYFVDNISSAHEKLIRNFNEKYKGQIKVITINLPFEKFSTNERKELLARYLRSKSDRIDVFAVDQIWVPRFAKWGVPLEQIVSKEMRENLLSPAMQSCTYNNKLIAIPLYLDVAMMYYRRDILSRLPDFASIEKKLESSITWDEFIKIRNMLGAINNPYYLFPAYDYEGLICQYVEMVASQKAEITSSGKLNLITPEAERALQLLADMVNKYDMSPSSVLKYKENPSYDEFCSNDGIFLRGWSSFLITHKEKFNTLQAYKNTVRIPTPHFSNGKPASIFGGWNLMISKYSSKIPESAIFINYLLSEEAQRILYEEGGYIPVNKNLYDNVEYLQDHKELMFYEKLIDTGVHRPFLENYTNISDVLSYYLHNAIKNRISVKEALLSAQRKINSETFVLK